MDTPQHYQSQIEPINVIALVTRDMKGCDAFDMGNIIKYICRAQNKADEADMMRDLEKARNYATHLSTGEWPR